MEFQSHLIESQFLLSLDQRSWTVLLFAFAGGFISSLLPCTVGMLPILVGYVGGYSEDSKWAVFRQVSLFILGIALVMTVLGVAASLLGMAFGTLLGGYWYYVVGGLALLMGLVLLEVIHLPLPQGLARLPELPAGRWLTPLLLGAAFGASSSPCGTPFLTAILGFISNEKNVLLGGASLFAYALGQSVPLLLAGMFTGLLKHVAIMRHVGPVIHKLSAVVFILGGLLLIAQGAGWLDVFAFYE